MSLFHASPRNAGLLYLIIILAGLSAELLLRGPAVEALAIGVAPVETLIPAFRLSALADLVMLMADVSLALVFFTLLSPISDGLARMAMGSCLGGGGNLKAA